MKKDNHIYILSTDRIDTGKASSMGGRALQLYEGLDSHYKCTMLLSKKCYDLLEEQYHDGNFDVAEFDFNANHLVINGSKKDILIVPVNWGCNFNKTYGFAGKIIGDLIAPVMVEGNADISNVGEFLIRCHAFIVANEAQRLYWLGVFSYFDKAWKLNEKPIYIVPMSAMRPNNLIPSVSSHIIISYGAMYPWIDYKAMIELFEKLDNKYMFCFDGIEHPLYRNDHLKPFYSYINRLPKSLKARIDINPRWNSEPTIATAGIVITKYPEYVVANRTRSMSFLAQGIPVITNKGDNIYNILDEGVDSHFIYHNELPIQVIENGIHNCGIWRKSFVEKVECLTGVAKVRSSLLLAIKGLCK